MDDTIFARIVLLRQITDVTAARRDAQIVARERFLFIFISAISKLSHVTGIQITEKVFSLDVTPPGGNNVFAGQNALVNNIR